MKKIGLIMLITILYGCIQQAPSRGIPDSWGGTHFKVVTVDSCEYIFLNNWFAHKGNCKFCKNRNQIIQ